MFKIDQSSFYSWPIKFEIPGDMGKHHTETFDAHFKRVSQTRVEEIIKAAGLEEGRLTDVELAKEVLIGWKGVLSSDDQEIPYSETAKEALLDIPGIAKAIVKAFFESLSGAKRKN